MIRIHGLVVLSVSCNYWLLRSWSYGSWINDFESRSWRGVFVKHYVWQWLAADMWFSLGIPLWLRKSNDMCSYIQHFTIFDCNRWRNGELNIINSWTTYVWQWLAADMWFSPGIPVSSTNTTDRYDIYDIAEILLKVDANTITLTHITTPNITWHWENNCFVLEALA
jgi:hypothetical protein